jgi:hypothetical protein
MFNIKIYRVKNLLLDISPQHAYFVALRKPADFLAFREEIPRFSPQP